MAALARGQVSEWRATQVVRETACLTREDRIRVDAELAARPGGLEVLGDAAAAAEARRMAYRLDPYAFTARAAKAATERCVTLRPAPDTMTWLTALLPVAQGVAAYASLAKAADTARASGQDRPRGQVMADTLVERLTGQATTDAVPLEVNLVMTDHAHIGDPDQPGGQEPVEVLGYGPVPAPLVRQWLAAAAPSPTGCAGSSTSATDVAARLGATRRSDTATTRSAPPTAATPTPTTPKDSAKPATTPRKLPGGAPEPGQTAPSRPSSPPGTGTRAPCHRGSAAIHLRTPSTSSTSSTNPSSPTPSRPDPDVSPPSSPDDQQGLPARDQLSDHGVTGQLAGDEQAAGGLGVGQ
jgi:hypothetical protein